MVVPFFLKTALSAESAWGVMPGRMPSSSLTTMSFSLPCTQIWHFYCDTCHDLGSQTLTVLEGPIPSKVPCC